MTDDTHTGADAPHWHVFKRFTDAESGWMFQFIEPGLAYVEAADHRFVIQTELRERDRSTIRVFEVAYWTGDDEDRTDHVPFHVGRDEGIARNNLSYACASIDPKATPHVLLREDDEGRRVYEFPSGFIAEKAADLVTRMKLETDEVDGKALAYSKDDWEDHLETGTAGGWR